MITVEFHETKADGSDVVTEVVTFDGREYHMTPPNDDILARLINRRMRDPQTRSWVTSAEPEKFMAALQYNYCNAYSWASAPKMVQPT